MIKLIKVREVGDRITFDDLYIEPDEIKEIEDAHSYNNLLLENSDRFPAGLSEGTKFSKVITPSKSYVVVGTMSEIYNKKNNRKRVLKG